MRATLALNGLMTLEKNENLYDKEGEGVGGLVMPNGSLVLP